MKLPVTAELLDAFLHKVSEIGADPAAAEGAPSCDSIAVHWRQLGLRGGDLVLLCLPNGRNLLRQFFGVLLAGGVPAMVTPMTPAARLREISQAMGAWGIGALRLPSGDLGSERIERFGPMQIALLPRPVRPAAAPGEVVLSTSGTSGFSSGCVFDFEALLLNAERHAESIGQRGDDVVLVNLPLHFSFALVAQMLASLVRGNQLVVSGPPFHASGYQRTLREGGITISSLTPFLIQSLLRSDVEFPSGLRVLTVGGDALAPDLVARLLQCRPGRELYLTYGLTQAGPRVSTLAAHAEPPERYASAGRPLAGTTVFLRDVGDKTDLKQLYVSSATVMKRTIGRGEGRIDQAMLPPQTVATGDVFEQDEAGYLYFKGRLSDYINRKGEKISLAAVRRVAAQLPHVVGARTVVIKHEDGSDDFDLELRVETSAVEALTHDGHALVRGLLRRADMPRHIRITPAGEALATQYK